MWMTVSVVSHYMDRFATYNWAQIHDKRGKKVRRRDIRKYVYKHLMLELFRAIRFGFSQWILLLLLL